MAKKLKSLVHSPSRNLILRQFRGDLITEEDITVIIGLVGTIIISQQGTGLTTLITATMLTHTLLDLLIMGIAAGCKLL